MNIKNTFIQWLESPSLNIEEKNTLKKMQSDSKLIEESFYKNLDFGTGGLRGIMGLGTNRINRFTIRKVSQGISNYLLKKKVNSNLKVAIAYDTRNNSMTYAFEAISVFSSNGIKSYIFNSPMPTPLLSYTVRDLNCSIGIVITASHNPKEYNGYKVYGPDGSQITDGVANLIIEEINKVSFLEVKVSPIELTKKNNLLEYISKSSINRYYSNVKSHSLYKGIKNLSIVYTPLHGSGLVPIKTLIEKHRYKIFLVAEQSIQDGNFPTVKSPNPEDKSALKMGVQVAESLDADVVFGTDPDADRIGLAVKHQNKYVFLNGNQIGSILIDYILKNIKLHGNEVILKTIVTSDLGSKISEKYGVKVINTLTGFKFIGEKINEFEKRNICKFLFGYEESFGFLFGTFVRDKDAIGSSLLISDAAQFHKNNGKTLVDALEDIEKEFGYYCTDLETFTFEGLEGQKKINMVMSRLRDLNILKNFFNDILIFEDYLTSIKKVINSHVQVIKLPKSNVIKIFFEDMSWIAFRPSGTEPKLKIYISVVSISKTGSILRFNEVKNSLNRIINHLNE